MGGRVLAWLLAAALLFAAAWPANAVENWYEKGLAALRERRYSEAISAFNKAIEQNPDNAGAYNSRGAAWHKMGVYERAIRDYTAALHLDPDLAGAYNNRGVAWYQRGETVRAIADYDRALSLDPDYVSALQNRAAAWRRTGDFDRAITDLRRAEQLQPAYDIYLPLAWILAACPDPRFRNGPAAEEYARKAVALRSDADSLGALAAAYAEQGRFDDALRLEQQIVYDLEAAGDRQALQEHLGRLQSFRARMPLGKTYLAGYGPDLRTFRRGSKTLKAANGDEPVPDPGETPAQVDAAKPAALPAELPMKGKTPAPATETPPAARARTAATVSQPPPKTAEPKTVAPPRVARKTILYPYTVQVASFRNPDTAVREALRLQGDGHPAFVSLAHLPSRGGDWHRLFIGRFETREAALRAAQVLKARDYRFARVVTMPYAVEVQVQDAGQSLREVQQRLKRRHLIAYPVTEDPASATTRLLVGAFSSSEQAAVTAEGLRADGLHAQIVSHPVPTRGVE
ncbi:MAG: tetratricopeptide repeat protein [Desulfobacteraceae bacterium]|nr:tetratricopeptide repeat protein [Desulfobacteraceae bacterium]